MKSKIRPVQPGLILFQANSLRYTVIYMKKRNYQERQIPVSIAVIVIIVLFGVSFFAGYRTVPKQNIQSIVNDSKVQSQDSGLPVLPKDAMPLSQKTGEAFDLGFLRTMLEHQRVTLDLIQVAEGRQLQPELAARNQRTVTQANGFIVELTKMANGLGYDVPDHNPEASREIISNLEKKSGTEFERQFLIDAIAHDLFAIEIANMVQRASQNADIKTIGEDVLIAATLDVGNMQDWGQKWGYNLGSSGAAPGHSGHGAN